MMLYVHINIYIYNISYIPLYPIQSPCLLAKIPNTLNDMFHRGLSMRFPVASANQTSQWKTPKFCSLMFLANTSIWFKGEFPSLLQHPNPNCSLIETLPLYPSNVCIWLVWGPPPLNNLRILYNSHFFLPPPSTFFWSINLRKDFNLLSIDFNLLSIDFNLLSINLFTFNLLLIYFQFTFNLLSIDFNLLLIYFQLISIYFQFTFNLLSIYF